MATHGRIEYIFEANFELRAGATTLNSFYERPILNSPYRAPESHHPLDQNGQPLEGEPRQGRRPSWRAKAAQPWRDRDGATHRNAGSCPPPRIVNPGPAERQAIDSSSTFLKAWRAKVGSTYRL